MSSIEFPIPAVQGGRVRQLSAGPAYTLIDYEVDPAGYSQSLTWSQAHRRAQVFAAELAVVSRARALPGPLPAVIEIDALDLDTEQAFSISMPRTKTALVQYTSGSTRQPAGVVVTQNILGCSTSMPSMRKSSRSRRSRKSEVKDGLEYDVDNRSRGIS